MIGCFVTTVKVECLREEMLFMLRGKDIYKEEKKRPAWKDEIIDQTQRAADYKRMYRYLNNLHFLYVSIYYH